MVTAKIIDRLIEAPVATSFTRLGYEARRRTANWRALDDYDLDERVVLVTGGTSGLGRAAARQLAQCGARVIIVGRDADRTEAAAAELRVECSNDNIASLAADMGDYDQVRALADSILASEVRLDALLHNAGALSDERAEAPDGTEATVASQVVGPFLLTQLLLPLLEQSAPARVITVSSGGMYTAGLTVKHLEMSPSRYRGAEQYARAKRAQVVLNEMWADKLGDRGVYFHSMHPGWADTPGVAEALPGFRRTLGSLLRTPEQGADTMVWLIADDTALQSNGKFWHDRQQRSIDKLPTTRKADTTERRDRLWTYVEAKLG